MAIPFLKVRYREKLSLPAQYTERVEFKDGLLDKMVCTVKFPVLESFFFCNTTHTNQASTRMDLEVW